MKKGFNIFSIVWCFVFRFIFLNIGFSNMVVDRVIYIMFIFVFIFFFISFIGIF